MLENPKYFTVTQSGIQIPIQVLLPPKPPLRWAREYPRYTREQIHRVMKAYTTFHCMLDYHYCVNFTAWAHINYPEYSLIG